MKVLIADDEQILRDLFSLKMKEAGYEVATAVDGEAAFDTIIKSKGEFDLLITDCNFKKKDGIDGRELSRRVRRLFPSIRIIMVSGGGINSFLPLLNAGIIDAFLGKPFTSNDLKSAVASLLSAKPALQQA